MRTYSGDPGDLWHKMGHAMWSLQLFEFSLAHFLVLASGQHMSEEEAFEQLERGFRNTLGQLVRRLKESVTVDEAMEARLADLGRERNWLAHHIRRLNCEDIYDEEKFVALLNRLHRLEREAVALAGEFQELGWKWCEARGIAREELEKEAERIHRAET